MWKDFFYFSKSQRIGILVLMGLILLALAANYTLPWFFPVKEQNGTMFLSEVEKFKKSLVSRDSLLKATRQREYEERYQKYQTFHSFPSYKKNVPYTLFSFDP
ncbi:MAG: hypothetical protein Q8904_11560, partial [Bacteroidota bacterium]|nr:hypothetical protein [Bacteroidota bacterium]